MILRLNANGKNFQKELLKKINKRSVFSNKDYNVAKKIVLDVKKNGDKAVLKYEFRFNKNKRINSNYSSISKIIKSLNPNVKKSIDFAYQRILKFHKNLLANSEIFGKIGKQSRKSENCCLPPLFSRALCWARTDDPHGSAHG